MFKNSPDLIKPRPTLYSNSLISFSSDAAKRVSDLEEIIGLKAADSNILKRLKNIEDKLCFIEERFPQIAIQYFTYSPSEAKGQGRTSLLVKNQNISQQIEANSNESKAVSKSCQAFLGILDRLK